MYSFGFLWIAERLIKCVSNVKPKQTYCKTLPIISPKSHHVIIIIIIRCWSCKGSVVKEHYYGPLFGYTSLWGYTVINIPWKRSHPKATASIYWYTFTKTFTKKALCWPDLYHCCRPLPLQYVLEARNHGVAWHFSSTMDKSLLLRSGWRGLSFSLSFFVIHFSM